MSARWLCGAIERGNSVNVFSKLLCNKVSLPSRKGLADEIRVKGKKGIFWMGLAMEVSSRLWLAGVVQTSRDHVLADRLLQQVRRCACGASQPLICVDGWASYRNAILRAFVEQVHEGIQTGKQQMQVWPQLLIGQVIKTQKKYRLVSVKHTRLAR